MLFKSWGFERCPISGDYCKYQSICNNQNNMFLYDIFPGICAMLIDFNDLYYCKNAKSKTSVGYRISYCLDGNYFTYIKDKKVLITTEEIFVGKSLPKTKESFTTKKRLIGFNIIIHPEDLEKNQFYSETVFNFVEKLKDINDSGLYIKSDRLIMIAKELMEVLIFRNRFLISLKALELINELCELNVNKNRTNYLQRDKTNKIIEIEKFLKKNLKEDINLKLLQDKYKISVSNLNNHFIQEFQFTPMNYLNNLRMLKAQELLIDTEMSITEIAENVGFNNPSNFSRSFKKFCGLSPREYRNNNL